MCGVFGFVRPAGASGSATADVFAELGRSAVGRGKNASGWATLGSPSCDWRTVKAPMTFDRQWAARTTADKRALVGACAAMGHTRQASQGAVWRMANCSPMRVGDVLGTHNGDVDAADLAERFDIEREDMAGETDTEVLLAALGTAPYLEVLEAVAGRVALIWADRRRPGRLFLARGAWSPLYVGHSSDGVLWWASCPSWLYRARADLADLYRAKEGTLVEVDVARAKIVGSQRFQPTARERDERAVGRVYAGIDQAEADDDMARHIHHTRPEPSPWPCVKESHAKRKGQTWARNRLW